MTHLSAFLGIAVLSLAAGASAKSDAESGDRELATSSYSHLYNLASYSYEFEIIHFEPPPPENDAYLCSTNSDTACGATDPYGDGCDYYITGFAACGSYDDEDFSAFEMCCACGGGMAGAYDCPTDDDYNDQPAPAGLCGQRRLKETDPFQRAVSKKAAQQPKRPDVFKHAAAVQQKRQPQATMLEPRHLQAGLFSYSYEVLEVGSTISYSYEFLHGMMSYSFGSDDDCTPSYQLLTCEDGSLMMGQGCDETCSSCAEMFDYTAWNPAGMYWCDDDYFYVDEDLDGTADGAGPLMCSDDCMMGDDDDGECYPSQMSMTCDAGSIVMHDQCDETCSSCGATFDVTAMSPAGMYWCDDATLYYDQDLDGTAETQPLDQMSCYWNDCGGSYSYSYGGGVGPPACASTCDSCEDAVTTDCMQCEQGTEDWMLLQEMCCGGSNSYSYSYSPSPTPYDCVGTCGSCMAALTTDCFTCAEGSEGWLNVQTECCYAESYSDDGFNPFAYRPCPAQAIVSTTMGMGGLTCADYGSEEEAATNAAVASLIDGVGEEDFGDHVCTDVSRRVRGRGLLTDEISLAFDITVTESTTDDAGALSATDLATSISTQIATVASSGALQSTIVAYAPADSALTSATVSTVETVATTSYTNAPTASAVTVSGDTTLVLEASAVSNMRVSMVVGALTVVVAALLQA